MAKMRYFNLSTGGKAVVSHNSNFSACKKSEDEWVVDLMRDEMQHLQTRIDNEKEKENARGTSTKK